MLRVCRSGGTIGLANWTPDGYGGDFFRLGAKYVPPPAGGKHLYTFLHQLGTL